MASLEEILGHPLTQTVVSSGSGIINNLLAGRRERQAREWQEEMWNKQNEYNLPVNQVQRLLDAGINPNLAFGSSASALGTSTPSSPTIVPRDKVDPAEKYLRAKEIQAMINQRESDTRRQDEVTEQLRLNNELLSSLFQDTLETKKGQMFIDRLIQGWYEDHGREMLDLGLTSAELRNDLTSAMKAYNDAKKDYTRENINLVKQQYDHLKNKYGFEDFYYNIKQNPYETSTVMGFVRTLLGMMGGLIKNNPLDLNNWPDLEDLEEMEKMRYK